MNLRTTVGTSILFATLGVGLITILDGYFTVDPNERVVVTRMGAITRTAESGLNFKLPFVESTKVFKVDIQDLHPKEAVNTYTVDNQEVDVMFNVFYHVDPLQIKYIYANVPDYQARLFTMSVDRLKAEMGKVNVTAVAESRGEIRDKVKASLAKDAISLGITVTDFQLTNLEYSKSFREAVSQAAVQKAGIESREYERQQAEKVAETRRIEAKGTADAKVTQAQADAKATQLNGEAQAAAIEAQAKALAANTNLVKLRIAERWSGVLPVNMYGSAPLPFINLTDK